uniref:Uncharacterized protein n=1 Tax=Romanomermis culicivorax TaxID=13658 RepID=A0A915HHW2_ROMCU
MRFKCRLQHDQYAEIDDNLVGSGKNLMAHRRVLFQRPIRRLFMVGRSYRQNFIRM